MKKILGFFLVALNITLLYGQSWTSEVNSITIGNNQAVSSASDRNGIHILYHSGGALKYGRINSTGTTLVSNVTVATGIGSYAAITTYNDKIYAVFDKNTDVYILNSSDGGNTWSAPISEYSRTESFNGLAATTDDKGTHITWSEYSGGVSSETYYLLAKTEGSSPGWNFFKEVSDYSNHTGYNPSIAVSANEVHVSYQPLGSGTTKTRDFLISQQTPSWEDPVTLQTGSESVVNTKTIVSGSNVHVISMEGASFYGGGIYYVRHYVRPINSTSYTATTLSDQYNPNAIQMNAISTNNGDLHLFYNLKNTYSNTHMKYNGSSWSTIINNLIHYDRYHVSAAGNDLYLVQEAIAYSDKLSLRYYNASPVSPTLMAIGTPNQVTVNWAWNPEPDINNYEIWRKYYRSRFDQQDWTLKSSPTTNTWTDPDFQLNSSGNTYTVYYKTKAKDKTNQYSGFSSEISTSAVMVFGKQGTLTADENIPDAYRLNQNYPNPFNPTSTISFAIKNAGQSNLVVYDELGREVAILFDGYLSPGTYEAKFDGSKLSSGTYFYKLTSRSFSEVKKMMLVK